MLINNQDHQIRKKQGIENMLHIDLRGSQSTTQQRTTTTKENPNTWRCICQVLILKILESWKIQFTNTLLIALL